MQKHNHLVDALRSASVGRETDVFIQGQGGRTFGEFFANAERFAALLIGSGLKTGDRVAAQVEKSIEALELYVGAVMAGGVFLPLNPGYTASEVEYFLKDASPQVFVVSPAREDELRPISEEASVTHLLTLGSAGDGSLVEGANGMTSEFSVVPRKAEDLAAILYTSGTTGRSKGAMLTHRALASNSKTLVEYWKFTPDDVLIHALPIFHTHGLFVATNVALMAGSSMMFMPKFDVDAILAAMPDSTALMGVPTFYTRLLDDDRLSADRTGNMRLFISGSAPLLAETHDRWAERTGHRILERYGMTETNMNTSNPYDGDRRAGTVGFPLPGIELRILDDGGAELGCGEIGSIEVRGDNVFDGYWQMPEKTAEELRADGWFITGDLGVRDSDGYVSIVGRSKDLIISGGFNVYPKEVEVIIDDIPEVSETAVIGVPHPDLGEAVVAIIVLSGEISAEQILVETSGRLASYKCPKIVKIVEALPRNTMGKVQKKALREQYSEIFSAA